MRRLFIAVAIAALATTPAVSATFAGSIAGPDVPPAGLLTIDFNAATSLAEIQGLSGNAHIVQGTVSGQYAQPFGGTTRYLSVPRNGGSGTATLDLAGYDFGGAVEGFSFYWGSIDLYNTVRIDSSLGILSLAFDGQGGNPPANGDQGAPANNRRVYFDLAEGETLNSVQFISTGVAFELDDIVFNGTAVPEPASWAMMIGGFGLIGGSLRSARREGRAQPQRA